MTTQVERKKIRLNIDMVGLKAGTILKLDFTGDIPVDRFWRRRFKDAVVDNCVELVKED